MLFVRKYNLFFDELGVIFFAADEPVLSYEPVVQRECE